ncbi:MAG: hypothetical protein IPO04_10855 [Cytophagaceae bacterium]|nr:hypothetical protein [Cytophagaceae bacterium]
MDLGDTSGSAGITVAWETWQQYGDKQLLEEHFDAMLKYINYLETKMDPKTGILNEGPLGDWLSSEGNKNDNTLFWMAYYAYDLDILAKMAKALGRSGISDSLMAKSQSIKAKFNETYLDQNGKTIKSGMKTGFISRSQKKMDVIVLQRHNHGTQASASRWLWEHLMQKQPHLALQISNSYFQKNTDNDGGVERPGIFPEGRFHRHGIHLRELSENGATDLAYKLLTKKQYPS